MNIVEIITKKRDGAALSSSEIEFAVNGYTAGDIPDYQMAALLMAICIKGMNREETICLTEVMRDSGDVIDLSEIKGTKVDKHSTGGVGDKTTLIVAPLAAACGIPIAKMSGRGLGFTGGTVDKMEAIPGFRTSMEQEEFINSVNKNRIAVIGQTGHIAPADKKIYALRDVTGTVENISLITSSIMSKKLAAGSDAIVLDVKCGSGAFMKNFDAAKELASWMVDIGKGSGKEMMAVISDMNQPLGNAVGNSLEVQEAIDVLKCQGPDDITELSIKLAGIMIALGTKSEPEGDMELLIEASEAKARAALKGGAALDKFREFVSSQGGNPEITEKYKLLPQAKHKLDIEADRDGFVSKLDALTIGLASQHAGAGREKKEDEIDMSAGILLRKKLGDRVEAGEIICTIYGNELDKLERAAKEAKLAYDFSEIKPIKDELIKALIQ